MFKKTGDNMPIMEIYGGDGNIETCHLCKKALTTVAIKEDDSVDLICECSNSNLESN